ncbi:MAG TPA: FAD-binding oxidoreductase [Ancylobacter sp.]
MQLALGFARQHGLEIAVRSGGHGFPGLSTVDGGLLIDLRPLNDVHVNPERRIARIRPGALGGDIVLETSRHGLSAVGGTRARVGFGGLAIFNGHGYLAPRYGNAVDQILALELVLADGRLVRATPTSNADLFWAVRGAGDSFGVVTAFEVALYPVPAQAQLGGYELDLATAADTLTRLDAEDPLLSEDLLWGVKVLRTAAVAPSLTVGYVHLGDEATRRRDLASIRALAPGAREHHETLSYADLYYRPGFTGSRAFVAGAQLTALDSRTSQLLVDVAVAAAAVPTPAGAERSLDFYPISKGLARPPATPNAWPVRSGYGFTARVSYDVPGQEAEHTGWADGVVGRLVEAGVTKGYNVTAINHVSHWTPDIIRSVYAAELDRLLAIKATYDPDNVFRRSGIGSIV